MKMLNDPHAKVEASLHGLNCAETPSSVSVMARSVDEQFRPRLHLGNDGQSLVEFALVLPVLLLVLTGIYSLGMFMLNYQTLVTAVDKGETTLELLPNMPASGSYPGATDPCLAVSQAVVGSAGTLVTSGANGIQLTVAIGSNSYGPSAPANSPVRQTSHVRMPRCMRCRAQPEQ